MTITSEPNALGTEGPSSNVAEEDGVPVALGLPPKHVVGLAPLNEEQRHYCPGCHHGTALKAVASGLADAGVTDRMVIFQGASCAALSWKYWEVDWMMAHHGRAPSVAAAFKKVLPDNVVCTYQGDGDLLAIGGGELLNAAARGDNITIFFINNAGYGMTGGQLAPTSLVGQTTYTTPRGRSAEDEGYPLNICALLSQMPGVGYVARGAVNKPDNYRRTRRFVAEAIKCQLEGRGLSLVEIVSSAPVCWRMEPLEAVRWLEQHLLREYPIGEYKSPRAGAALRRRYYRAESRVKSTAAFGKARELAYEANSTVGAKWPAKQLLDRMARLHVHDRGKTDGVVLGRYEEGR